MRGEVHGAIISCEFEDALSGLGSLIQEFAEDRVEVGPFHLDRMVHDIAGEDCRFIIRLQHNGHMADAVPRRRQEDESIEERTACAVDEIGKPRLDHRPYAVFIDAEAGNVDVVVTRRRRVIFLLGAWEDVAGVFESRDPSSVPEARYSSRNDRRGDGY